MRGAISPLPHTSSWRGAWLITGTALPYLREIILIKFYSLKLCMIQLYLNFNIISSYLTHLGPIINVEELADFFLCIYVSYVCYMPRPSY
jgi:hypothetical protein